MIFIDFTKIPVFYTQVKYTQVYFLPLKYIDDVI
jgi:hypothetical protein